ncbi:hypothetical protein Pmar_PMAR003601 [Perkinsus marinus ATCC 50983]|uniref:Uncharacterized protein n=1 Tax=Perkinsus marinus (strain ATCC 50983 / TXsc) TaxID=423536 RepID=C5KHS6_PERM5|nr:hypothetical protein Pmar_PMAR003601 [Perkinsus marinus ATCC 50983]EER16138.1 hypothetical protein Pmar_PMAR003601 [Perkinsus marinus ATCC 50983]|eukprot:XP_002784342.1 hypothetical protein Pmar_PMAR003601 [Perkinsus marinus ATCC 50983]
MGRNEEGGPIPMLGMGLNEEREPISMLDMGESAPAPTSENIPWGRLQPARLKFLKHGTLAEKRLSAWQHWAAVTLTSMAIMVIAAHFVVCFRGMCSKGAGSSDLSAQPQQQQQLDSAGHATMAYGVPINGSYPLRTLISPGEGPTASVKGQGSSARGSKCGPNGGCKSGPRQQLQFDRFVVRGANTGPSAASAFGSKVLSVGGPHGYHKVNTWGYGGRYTPGLRGGYYYRHSYGMKDMFNIASGDDNEDDDYGSIEGRGTTAGEVYYGLDGRARVVQYPQTLVVPEDDETPEEFAARQKGRRTYEHCGGVTPAWLGR